MDVTILGSGSPIPDPQRSGTAICVETGGETALIDCGPGTVEGMMKQEIDPSTVESVFFTHHHMDHNASFFHFAISSWMLGRRDLTVYGPTGTDRVLEAMAHMYQDDFEYRETLGRSLEGLTDIESIEFEDELSVEFGDCTVSSFPADHSIETYGYRFENEASGESFVFTGDTAVTDELVDFAAGADVLLHDCCVGAQLESPPDDKPLWPDLFDPDEQYLDRLSEVHATPAECGKIAADANVDALVLTHLTPYLDTSKLKSEAQEHYDGTVVVAEDGLAFSTPV